MKIAKKRNIELRQSYSRVGDELLRQQARYAHARQMKRSSKATKKLRNYLGRVIREVERDTEKLTKRETDILELVKRLTGCEVLEAYCDKGYRLKKEEMPENCRLFLPGVRKRSMAEKKRMKRRNAIEPIIGHLKSDFRMDRCWLQGALGDALHSISCAAGYNLRWLMRAIARLGIGPVFLRLLQAALSWLRGPAPLDRQAMRLAFGLPNCLTGWTTGTRKFDLNQCFEAGV